jgi:hypothetical protein
MIRVAVSVSMPTAMPTVISTVGKVMVSTIAGTTTPGSMDGPGLKATFNAPYGVTLNKMNIYIPDQVNNKIRVYNLMSKNVTTLKVSGLL